LPGGPAESALGIGEVAVRDFGRWLGGAYRSKRQPERMVCEHILAEGFNADPEMRRSVYQGAFTRNGNCVVLAINGFAAGGRQFPYAQNDLGPILLGRACMAPP
jgi:hypothetical protein